MATSVTHLTVLKKLKGDTGLEDLSSDVEKTIAAMDARYSFSSTRVALTALRKEYPVSKRFIDEIKERGPKWKDLDQSQEATQKQEDKFVSWDNILKFRDEYYDEMSPVQRLLMALYTRVPPVRLDYTPMKIVDRKPRQLEEGMNYYVRGATAYFLFHAYKTHDVFGDRKVKVPVALKKEIEGYLSPGQTYLLEDEGKPWSEPRLSQNVSRIFQQFHNLNTGVSMMRHAYATKFHKGQLPLKEIKKTASAMLHGPLQSMSYRFIALE